MKLKCNIAPLVAEGGVLEGNSNLVKLFNIQGLPNIFKIKLILWPVAEFIDSNEYTYNK